jgi:hypothetical protein
VAARDVNRSQRIPQHFGVADMRPARQGRYARISALEAQLQAGR